MLTQLPAAVATKRRVRIIGTPPAIDTARQRELLERAIERSGLSLRDFARRELVRDEKTLRLYRRGRRMPAVVLEKVVQLARRRRAAQGR